MFKIMQYCQQYSLLTLAKINKRADFLMNQMNIQEYFIRIFNSVSFIDSYESSAFVISHSKVL